MKLLRRLFILFFKGKKAEDFLLKQGEELDKLLDKQQEATKQLIEDKEAVNKAVLYTINAMAVQFEEGSAEVKLLKGER